MLAVSARTDDARRRAREMVGWSILTTVVGLSRLAIWLDGRLAADDDAS